MRLLFIGGEIRSLEENRRISGRALSFGVESSVLYEDHKYFTETLLHGCITNETIRKSDIVINYNHDRDQILGRSNKGAGSLKLDLRNDGLYFSVDVPNTRFGDEMLELVKRGDICSCSFAFDVKDEDVIWTRNKETGIMHREIKKINRLYDVSIVVDPAYPETYVKARMKEAGMVLDDIKTNNQDIMEEKLTIEQVSDILSRFLAQERSCKEEEPEERAAETDSSDDAEVETEERAAETETPEEPETPADSSDAEDDAEEPAEELINTKRNIKNNNIIMNKNVTLVQLIRKAMDNNERKFTLSMETRTQTVNGVSSQEVDGTDPYAVGDTTVVEEYQSIVEPLYNNQIIKNLGIHVYSGAPKGDYNFPVMGKTTVGFASEIAAASATGVTTTNVHLSPKRITGYIDISKQLLLQDTLGLNEAIRRDLYNAIADAIQNAMFDANASSDTRPAGLLNGLTAATVSNFKSLTDLEADLEDVNFENLQYVVSNKAYSSLRNLAKSAKTTELVLENGTIDGVKVTRTGALSDRKIIVGDFSQVVMAIWQDAEVVVDEISQAINGCVRLVISAYVDWTLVRPNAIKYATIS